MLPIELSIPAFIAGIALLYKGSDILVDGTSKTAARIGVSSLIISLIIVAFGTSAPEFAISVGAAVQHNAGISLGNIIGSCVANLLLVIGLSAVIRPIRVSKSIIKREMPILLVVTVMFLSATFLGILDTYHLIGSAIFLVSFSLFIIYFIQCAQKERITKNTYNDGNTIKNTLFIIFGIIGVIIGAWLLIESATCIADFFSIPSIIIAISMVAVGTSLPELVVSAMAAYKDESDIAVGNVLGSNVFNILLILGVGTLFIPLNALGSLDHIIFLVAVTIFMIPILFTGHNISRVEGSILLVLYAIYMVYTFRSVLFL